MRDQYISVVCIAWQQLGRYENADPSAQEWVRYILQHFRAMLIIVSMDTVGNIAEQLSRMASEMQYLLVNQSKFVMPLLL